MAEDSVLADIEAEPPAGGAPEGPTIPSRRSKKLRMDEAMRASGVDENTIADTYAEVLKELKEQRERGEVNDKLLMRVLKECSRILEPRERRDREAAVVQINLVHSVARPQRG